MCANKRITLKPRLGAEHPLIHPRLGAEHPRTTRGWVRSIPEPPEVGCGASLTHSRLGWVRSVPALPEVGCAASLPPPEVAAVSLCSVASATFSGAPAQRSF
eukprot:s9679_g1.t1